MVQLIGKNKKLIMKKIQAILKFTIMLSLPYLALSFIELNMNLFSWDKITRGIFILFEIFAFILGMIFSQINFK